MNALISSQMEALKEFAEGWGRDGPIRFEVYPGQTRPAARDDIIRRPPHILLTNDVMLEYLLIRQAERCAQSSSPCATWPSSA